MSVDFFVTLVNRKSWRWRSSREKGVDANGTKTEVATAVGKKIAEKALAAGFEKVVFDRNGFVYHGRVKALADGAREGGLKF